MVESWMEIAKKRSLADLKRRYGLSASDNVVFWLLYYSKYCYILSDKEYEKYSNCIYQASMIILLFCGSQLLFISKLFSESVSEWIACTAFFSVFVYSGIKTASIFKAGKRHYLGERPYIKYSELLAAHSPTEGLSASVRKIFIVFFVFSILSFVVIFKGHYGIFIMMFLFLSVMWWCWYLLFKASLMP